MAALGIALTSVLVLGLTACVFHLLRRRTELGRRLLLGLLAAGALAGLGSAWLQRLLWDWTGLQITMQPGNTGGSLIAMLALAVPLEEASKLLIVWLLYQRGRLRVPADGVMAAVAAAAGFAVAETSLYVLSAPATGVIVLQSVLGALAHLLFAGAWGFVLNDTSGARWLRTSWFIAVLFHGLFDHIVYGRTAGTLVLVGPLLLGMLGLAWLGLRDLQTRLHSGPATSRRSLAPIGDRPSLEFLRNAVRPREKPLMVSWIVIGTFVTTGVALTAVTLAVYVGHRLGVDFAAAEEGDVRANAPLLLLGSALMAAFPIAGYLVARASATDSVLEPAIGAAASIAMVVVLLSMAAPVAVVFSLAVAPVAFGLACLGAWFGMGR